MRGYTTAEVEVEEDQFNHTLVPEATYDSLPIAEMQRIIPGVKGGVVGVIAYHALECKKSLPIGFVASMRCSSSQCKHIDHRGEDREQEEENFMECTIHSGHYIGTTTTA